MFKTIKKKKLQENENIEKNENIATNENISVNSENISENLEFEIPSALDILEETKLKWKEITVEEIFKKVKCEVSKGNRSVRIYDSLISDELVKELTAKGYRVKVYPLPNTTGPYFEIYW